MSHHVAETLPGGREIVVDYRSAGAQMIRRIHAARMDGKSPAGEDMALLTAWADEHPGEICTFDSVLQGCHQDE